HILDLEELFGDGREQDPAVDVRLLVQLARLDLVELILKALQPLDFGIDGEPAIIADLAIVLVEAEGDTLKWSGCEVAPDKVEYQLVEIVRFRCPGRLGQAWGGRNQGEREHCNQTAERFHRPSLEGNRTLSYQPVGKSKGMNDNRVVCVKT